MSDINNLVKSNLLKLHEWLSIEEAAEYLSRVLGEKISTADLYKLAIGRKVVLSVNLMESVSAKCGKIVTDIELKAMDKEGKDLKYIELGQGTNFVYEDKLRRVDGIWDLAMVGGELLDVGSRYYKLTNKQIGPKSSMNNFLLKKDNEEMCSLYELTYMMKRRAINDKNKGKTRGSYYTPICELPEGAEHIVRSNELIRLQNHLKKSEQPQVGEHLYAPVLDKNHPFHAQELKITVEAWTYLYDKNPPQNTPVGGHKKYILSWLEKHHPAISDRAKERISIIINPNRKGGASPMS